jgi:hypothetical protein
MTDLAELFPGVDLGSTPKNGGCAAPIGRRQSRRAQPALRRFRPPSATVMMLASLRKQLGDGFTSVGIILKQMGSDVARTADSTADLVEAVDQLRVRLTSLERALGTIEAPSIPRHTRRRPLD